MEEASYEDEEYDAVEETDDEEYDPAEEAEDEAPEDDESEDEYIDLTAREAEPSSDTPTAQAGDADATRSVPVANVLRHIHRYYSSELIVGDSVRVFSEQRVVIEHLHDTEDEVHEHQPADLAVEGAQFDPAQFLLPSGGHKTRILEELDVEDTTPSIPEPFVPQASVSEGVLIPRQPERERQQEPERSRESLTGRGSRKGAAARPGQPTWEQLESGVIMTAKARMPAKVLMRQLMAYVERERRTALDVRDPIAITYAAERFSVLTSVLEETKPEEEVDLLKPLLTVSQAAKMLGYNAKELRRLLGQGKVSGRKVGNEWRIPLRAVL